MAKRRKSNRVRQQFWRINQNIRTPQLRVIDQGGKQVGVFSLREALAKAEAAELDLVEIAPKANPPVAKIIDFAKFRYQQEKKAREEKKKEKRGAETKEIWFTPFMAENDYSVRLGRVREFLEEGHKVRVTVKFKGRQMGRKEFGYELTRRVVSDTKGIAGLDQEPKFIGRQLMMMLSPVRRKAANVKSDGEKEKQSQN